MHYQICLKKNKPSINLENYIGEITECIISPRATIVTRAKGVALSSDDSLIEDTLIYQYIKKQFTIKYRLAGGKLNEQDATPKRQTFTSQHYATLERYSLNFLGDQYKDYSFIFTNSPELADRYFSTLHNTFYRKKSSKRLKAYKDAGSVKEGPLYGVIVHDGDYKAAYNCSAIPRKICDADKQTLIKSHFDKNYFHHCLQDKLNDLVAASRKEGYLTYNSQPDIARLPNSQVTSQAPAAATLPEEPLEPELEPSSLMPR